MKKIVVTQDVWLTNQQKTKLSTLWDVIFYDLAPSTKEEWLVRCQWADIIYSEELFMHENIENISNVFITFPFSWFLKPVNLDLLRKNWVVASSAKGWNKYAVAERNIAALLYLVRNLSQIKEYTNSIPRAVLSSISWLRDLKVLILWKWNIGVVTWDLCNSLWAHVTYFTRNEILQTEWYDVIINCLSLNESTVWFLDKIKLNWFNWYYITSTRHETHNDWDIVDLVSTGEIKWYATDCASIAWWDAWSAYYQDLVARLHWTNSFITPHIAWSTVNAVVYSNDICIDNIQSYLQGNPTNLLY